MIPLVAERSEEIAELCRRHQVQRLDLFGSAATDDFDPERSDLDFLVTFLPEANATYVGVYHRLYTDLGELFDRPVDLVIESDFRNPYFRQAVEESRTSIYESMESVTVDKRMTPCDSTGSTQQQADSTRQGISENESTQASQLRSAR